MKGRREKERNRDSETQRQSSGEGDLERGRGRGESYYMRGSERVWRGVRERETETEEGECSLCTAPLISPPLSATVCGFSSL